MKEILRQSNRMSGCQDVDEQERPHLHIPPGPPDMPHSIASRVTMTLILDLTSSLMHRQVT